MRYLLIFSLLFLAGCINNEPIDTDKDSIFLNKKYVTKVAIDDFNNLGKTYFFIKVWGFLKYNADFNDTDVDWDMHFLTNINKLSGMNRKEYADFIEKTIALFPEPDLKKTKNNIEKYSLIDNSWFKSTYFNKDTNYKLNYIFENRATVSSDFIDNNRMGNLKFLGENDYSDNDFPAKEIRLLGLARYWSIINYFYVYKNDMSENWDHVLISHIPKFSGAVNTKAYHLAAQELSSKLYDCHSMVYSNYLDNKVFGRFTPNFRIKRIDTTFVVTHQRTKKFNDGKIRTGDIILDIDNTPVNQKYKELLKIMRGANTLSEQRIICPYVVSKTEDKMTLLISREGKQRRVELKLNDYSKYREEENNIKDSIIDDGIVAKKLTSDTFYLDMTYVSDENLTENLEEVKDSKNLILDMRNQFDPEVCIDLANFLLSKESDFFSTSYSDVSRPGLLRIKKGYTLGKDNGNSYSGTIYILVDEHTQSSAEFMVMALQASTKTTVVGSQTAGSDGNIVEFNFPGNIRTVFTGIGIYYPDYKATQRNGIKIDYKIDQTVQGIQNGQDEVLGKCLSLIGSKKM